MTPQGRKKLIHNIGKHKLKAQKKNPGWWEDIIEPSKRRDRQESKQQIKNIVSELSLS